MDKPCAVILGITSDIGRELAERLLRDGWEVVGLSRILQLKGGVLSVKCDLSDRYDVLNAMTWIKQANVCWDLFISAVGTTLPIGKFFDLDFDEWEDSFMVNSTAQLRVLHGLWPLRRKDRIVDVMFMAGGGSNGAMTNYSAYAAAKLTLIKMCELLDDENKDANIFIIGPGYVNTKIHRETLNAGPEVVGKNYDKVVELLKTPGTSHDDIYAHMQWCMKHGRDVTGGRNFSTAYDPWRDGGEYLALDSATYPDKYRLRRRGAI